MQPSEMRIPIAARAKPVVNRRVMRCRGLGGRSSTVRRLATAELPRTAQSGAMEHEPENDLQRGKPVDDAASEVDRARLFEIARGHAYLPDPHVNGDGLSHELLIEDKIDAVEAVRDRLEQAATVGSEPRVVLGEVEAES